MTEDLLIHHGWLKGAFKIPSPNFNNRLDSKKISLLVIHCIALPPKKYGGDDIIDLFCNQLDCSKNPYYSQLKDLKVSAHLLIRRTGEIIQFVSFEQRAWHAGESVYHGQKNCNDYSIGIELEGSDDEGYEKIQYENLAKITKQLKINYPLIQNNIVGHEHIAPLRKTDPGVFFDWVYFFKLLAD